MSDKRETHKNQFRKGEDNYKLVAITDPEEPLKTTQDGREFYSCFKAFKDGEVVIEFYLEEFYDKEQVKQQFSLIKKYPNKFFKK